MSTVGEYFESTSLRGLDEGLDRDGIVQSFVGTPADGSLELPTGAAGPDGDPGPAAYAFRHEGDIADDAALQSLAATLRPVHAGKAWRVLDTNTLMVWNGRSFDAHPDAFGGHGPTGEVNTLTIGSVTTGAVGADLEVTISGAPPAQTVDLVVPRGVKGVDGSEGSPGPLRLSSDYDNTPAHVDGMVPLWSVSAGKWVPTPYPGWRGPWTILEGQAWDGGAGFAASQTNVGTSPNTIAIVNVPAQDCDWRPLVLGAAVVRTIVTDTSVRVDLEARLGGADGQILGFGSGMGYAVDWANTLQPHYATAAVTPSSGVGVVAAGAPAQIYIVLRRNVGSGNYTYTRTSAHVAVWAVPVTGAPA
ncbi:hypothetical protein [Nocardia cyriacigeorgica]|uniref:hypothetical protein n=1 Tax=Nocardia cyriacigeorgica TaxID=135487 RepID=UPI0034DAEF25